MEIRNSLFSKWKDPHKGRKYFKFNRSVGTHTNKLAALVSRLVNSVVPKVFPFLEIVILCAPNYDENRKVAIKKNTQEEIVSISEREFCTLLDMGPGFKAERPNECIVMDKLA